MLAFGVSHSEEEVGNRPRRCLPVRRGGGQAILRLRIGVPLKRTRDHSFQTLGARNLPSKPCALLFVIDRLIEADAILDGLNHRKRPVCLPCRGMATVG